MVTIYHNPRCSKSRQGLGIVEESGHDITIVKYLEEPLSEAQLSNIIGLLDIAPIDLVRKNETIWKQQFKGKELSDKEIVRAMVQHPKLIERPIVVHGDKAVIGRPPVAITSIL